ncbi:MAG TPA: 50S ribosomal protein L3 [Candidatus Cloacimonetes bacterium]|jgi:large subunit ribosomal protein L3|nr:50S ribosomal protein L3 [Candidatus Cloacimonas sp.]HHZ15762.1 50S ribosomal protein L3 [Candidatus Cloacimonadota bacterium]
MLGLIGKKIGMTQIFDSDGKVIPVTVLKAGPCRIVSKRSVEDHGYDALQLGYEEIKEKNCPRPVAGHFKKNDSPLYRYLREFRPSYGQDIDAYEVGTELNVDMFDITDTVTVTAKSKGRGFAGVMKRHNFGGFEQSHGVHESYRGPGSIGQSATPSRVFKGTKLPGQMGNARVSVRHLKVAKVDLENGLIMVKGAVPGHRNSLVLIQKET